MKENHHVPTYSSIVRFEEHLSLRSLSARKRANSMSAMFASLPAYSGKDPSVLEEPEARAYLLYLKEHKRYAPSSMRIAVAALQMFFKDVPWPRLEAICHRALSRPPEAADRAEQGGSAPASGGGP